MDLIDRENWFKILIVWPKIEDLFNDLKDKYDTGQIDKCIEFCLDTLQTHPDHFLTLCYYSRCLYHKEDYEKSADYLTRCIEKESNHFFVWKFRGDCYYKLGKYEIALEDYQRSLVLCPTNGATIDDIAQCYFLLGDYQKAHAYIDQVIRIEKESDMPMVRKAQFFEFQRDTKSAIEQYKKVLIMFPDSEYAIKKIKELI